MLWLVECNHSTITVNSKWTLHTACSNTSSNRITNGGQASPSENIPLSQNVPVVCCGQPHLIRVDVFLQDKTPEGRNPLPALSHNHR